MAERKGLFGRVVLPLLEKVLVPIVCAVVGALGVYYAEIAKLAKEAAEKAAQEEVLRATEAREFVNEHMDELEVEVLEPLPEEAGPRPEPEVQLDRDVQKLIERWEEKRPVDPDRLDMQQRVPADYLRAELRAARAKK